MTQELKPNEALDSNDTGDDTLLRYRYQITCAVIAALQMFNQELYIDEIYCEQFEDYLLKEGNQFIGIQVKTKNLNDTPFRLGDDTIAKIIQRFVRLDHQFPDEFKGFSIVSNHGFAKDKAISLKRMIYLAQTNDAAELLRNRTTTKKVIANTAKKLVCSENDVINTICKIKLKGSFATLEDIKQKLIFALSDIDFVSEKSPTLTTLEELADVLVVKFFEMSSLGNYEENLSDLFISKNQSDKEKISGKRIGKEQLKEVIANYLSDPITLAVNVPESIRNIKSTNDRLEVKMDRGGIDFNNVNLHKDHKYSAQSHLLSLLYKYGSRQSDDIYNQVRLIVQTECQESYDENFKSDGTFGIDMLKDVRKRIRLRLNQEKEKFKGMSYEHVIGVAAILTEECKVWWSEKFEIE